MSLPRQDVVIRRSMMRHQHRKDTPHHHTRTHAERTFWKISVNDTSKTSNPIKAEGNPPGRNIIHIEHRSIVNSGVLQGGVWTTCYGMQLLPQEHEVFKIHLR